MKFKPAFACRSCGAAPLLLATDLDAAVDELTRIGWRWYVTKGAGRARWTWDCPECWAPTEIDGRSAHSRFAHIDMRETTCPCRACEAARHAANALADWTLDDEVKF